MTLKALLRELFTTEDLSVSARLFGLFLFPFSILFKFIVKVRVFLYSKSLVLKDKPLDCLVIVVGNLTVGGTGKTPIVERFARELIQGGKGRDFESWLQKQGRLEEK